jgi:hypothetical protein
MKVLAVARFLLYAGGGMMTPEEQFMKIENALRHAAEVQAQHAEAIARDEAAIRDLIVVSRALVDTAKLHSEQIAASSEQIAALNQQIAASNLSLNEAFDRAEEERKRDREDFNVKFNALLQAQQETEQKLQRWIDRQGHS